MRGLLQLRLLTAQRGGEILSMRWQDLDLPTKWWTIPGERAKNGLAHRVPLSPPAFDILRSLQVDADKRDPKSPWVFASTRRSALNPIEHAQKAVERVRQRSGLDFRGHDLRRTAASLMVGAGTPRLVVSKILNHVEQGVTAVYDRHSYDAEKRAALDAWGLRVMAIVAARKQAAKPADAATTAGTPAESTEVPAVALAAVDATVAESAGTPAPAGPKGGSDVSVVPADLKRPRVRNTNDVRPAPAGRTRALGEVSHSRPDQRTDVDADRNDSPLRSDQDRVAHATRGG